MLQVSGREDYSSKLDRRLAAELPDIGISAEYDPIMSDLDLIWHDPDEIDEGLPASWLDKYEPVPGDLVA